MSFSNPTPTNPAQHFFEWHNGGVEFYDKEKKESISVPLPFEFIVLDQLHTITGYSDEDESGFWSNELRSLANDFNVRTKKGTQYVGPYKVNGIAQVPNGARYTKSVYIAHKNRAGELILGNLKVTGAALTSWIDTLKGVDFGSYKVIITGSTEGKKGSNTYKIPTFETSLISPEEHDVAFELDTELQTYLDTYLKTPKEEDVHEDYTDDDGASSEEVADFEAKRDASFKERQNKQAAKDLDIPVEDINDGKDIDLSEIPFN